MDFFNGLGKKLTGAARSVQEFTRDSVENTRTGLDLRSARAELEKQYAELGRAYFESVEHNRPVPDKLLDDVRDSIRLIESLLIQRQQSRRLERCPGCGTAMPAGAKFCSSCGQPMPEKMPEPDNRDNDVQYCPECGAMRQGASRYCALCGQSFENETPLVPIPAARVLSPTPEEPECGENYAE